MPSLTRRLLPAATLLIAFATAQTCYYPDGKTVSSDIPCDPTQSDSSCCGADSFCLANGLCYANGLVSRGSCTDKTWGSEMCATACLNVGLNSEVAISPCTGDGTTNTFACGVNTNDCSTGKNTFVVSNDAGLILRPSQIAQLVGSAISTAAPQSNDSGLFPAAALAGVAIGVALPLLIALAIMYFLLRREKHRFSKPKLMYKLPDEVTRDEFTFTPPPAMHPNPAFSSNRSSQTTNATATSTIASRRMSRATNLSLASPHPMASQSFMERYESMKKHGEAQIAVREVMVPASPRAELDSPSRQIARYELSEHRMSKGSNS